jgi:CBS domain-containing protein
VRELNLGTYTNLIHCEQTATLIDVLNLLIENRISSIPIVDKQMQVLDVYEKYDALV